MDLQRRDLVAFEPEDELKVDRAAAEIPGDAIRHDGFAASSRTHAGIFSGSLNSIA